MTKTDPIIAVKDIKVSSRWYQSVFECRSLHGGKEFDVLVDEDDEIMLCLHLWGAHDHPTLMHPEIPPGNGLILYFRTDKMNAIRENAGKAGAEIVEDIHLNTNSRRMEFSIRDLDGYYLTITEFHRYEG